MKRKNKAILILIISILILFILNMIYFINYSYRMKFELGDKSIDNMYELCNNKDFFETSKCLNAYVRTIFNYNVKSNPKNLTQLIDNGGVCKDYAEFYAYYLKEFGYKYQYVDTSHIIGLREGYLSDPNTLYLGDKYLRTGHMFIVGYGDNGYCSLDMKLIDCHKLKF